MDDSGYDETVAAPSVAELGTLQTKDATQDHLETLDRDSDPPSPVRTPDEFASVEERKLARGDALGRYVVLDILGAGGMGEVYAAYDPELDRKVALKVLRPTKSRGAGASVARSRLLREAQSMAKLSHPNVISVFDVGTIDGDVYVAMEFVDGSDLRGWLDKGERGWPEILEVFRSAANGLAAAHDAGLVHRDFKPDNVLIGADGRVRVIDFGLARQADDALSGEMREEGAPDPPSEDEIIQSVRASMNDAVTTKTGAIMGTPAYMAPEQFFGSATDHRTDQFNFCASLYEALYGRRAFAGDTVMSLMENVTGGRYRRPKSDSDVPSWLVPAILRGLDREPEQRYESMGDLLIALEPPVPLLHKLRIPVAIGGAVVVLGALGLFFMMRAGGGEAPCQNMDEHLVGVWDDDRKDQVRAGLKATNLPFADEAWTLVETRLDDYSKRWISMRVEACEATAVRKEQTAEMLEKRMVCLDNRLREVRTLAVVLSTADDEIVERASQAVQGLAPVADCGNRERLLAGASAPTALQKPIVDELEDDLARVKVLQLAGRYDDALPLARMALVSAREAAWKPAEARALYWIGDMESRKGDVEAAAESLFEAIRIASSADDQVTEAMAWITVTHVIGLGQKKYDEGHRWVKHAEIAIGKAGGDRVFNGRLTFVLGHILTRQLDYEGGLRAYRAALATLSDELGADHWLVAVVQSSIASVLTRQGNYEKAVDEHRQSIEVMERAVGTQHPRLAIMSNNLGNPLTRLQRWDEAKAAYQRALELKIATHGENNVSVSRTLNNLGNIESRTGNFDAAEKLYKRGLAARRAALGGDDNKEVAASRGYLQVLYTKMGRFDEALALLDENIEFYNDQFGPKSVEAGSAHSRSCFVIVRANRLAEGADHCAPAVAIMTEKAKDPRDLATALTHAGLYEVDTANPAAAVPKLERALEIRLDAVVEPQDLAHTEFGLARALADTGGDTTRALSLAKSARARLTPLGIGDQWLLAEVDAWLAAL